MLMGMVDVVIPGAVPAVGGAALGACAGAGAGRWGVRLLRGLARPVRPRPAWCAGGVAAVWAVVLAGVGAGALAPWWAPVPLLLGWFGVLLTVCDLIAYRLPDALTLPAYPVVFAAVVLASGLGGKRSMVAAALLGAVVFAGCYALVRLLAGDGLGPGDVKLSGSLGAAVGAVSPAAVLVVMGVAAIGTVLAGSLRRAPVPHGPAMIVPAWVVTLVPGVV